MSHLSPEEVKRHVKVYVGVFVALAVLTVFTVAVSYFHLPVFWAVLVALVIASFKGALVMAYFMHLKGEKLIIHAVLLVTLAVIIGLFVILPIFHF